MKSLYCFWVGIAILSTNCHTKNNSSRIVQPNIPPPISANATSQTNTNESSEKETNRELATKEREEFFRKSFGSKLEFGENPIVFSRYFWHDLCNNFDTPPTLDARVSSFEQIHGIFDKETKDLETKTLHYNPDLMELSQLLIKDHRQLTQITYVRWKYLEMLQSLQNVPNIPNKEGYIATIKEDMRGQAKTLHEMEKDQIELGKKIIIAANGLNIKVHYK